MAKVNKSDNARGLCIAEILSNSQRKPPRLARILETDRLAIIVTNRRARAGIRQDRIKR